MLFNCQSQQFFYQQQQGCYVGFQTQQQLDCGLLCLTVYGMPASAFVTNSRNRVDAKLRSAIRNGDGHHRSLSATETRDPQYHPVLVQVLY